MTALWLSIPQVRRLLCSSATTRTSRLATSDTKSSWSWTRTSKRYSPIGKQLYDTLLSSEGALHLAAGP